MPKRAPELSPAEVRRITKPGLHAVGGVSGLLLRVTDSGARNWVLRTTVGKKRRDIGLGGSPDVGLAAARNRARDAKDAIREGRDPVEERREARRKLIEAQASQITFDEAARQYIANKRHEFRNPKHGKQWESTLATYASPHIGNTPVSEVDLHAIVRVLQPIWNEKTETASRLRGRIESVLAWATTSGYRSGDNPARWKGHLDTILPKPSKVATVKHHPALPIDEIGGFIRKLRQRQGMAARALEFLILTAARSGEVRGATWDEIDLDKQEWTIPGERMKGGREHRVPLSDDAVAVLKAVPSSEGSPYVFHAARGGMLSDAALGAVLKRMGYPVTPHGFRSTFRDWCSEHTSYPHEVFEMALAHSIPDKVERAYRRGDLFRKRARLMAEWARFCTKTGHAGEVAKIRQA